MTDPLRTYRAKRDRRRTPEPVPAAAPLPTGGNDTFVIQEHHATALHWDLRLERDGVLVSWAIPRGLPRDPKRNNLAVHTEDHPLEYADFSGEIPAGEYGGGSMTIWDRGHYDTEKWRDDEVIVRLRGERAQGRYVLFRTDGKNWMIHRMDAADPNYQPLPELIPPMLAVTKQLPSGADDERHGYEMKWDGVRVVLYVSGGRGRAMSRSGRDVTATYPELREVAAALGSTEAVLDGEVVAFGPDGRVNFGALQPRMHVSAASQARRLMKTIPVAYFVFDLLHLDGRSTVELPYRERRRLLESLELRGPHWQTPPYFAGHGEAAMATSEAQGLEGVVAKRLDSPYRAGRRNPDWIKAKHDNTQEVVIGGWRTGTGRREQYIGSLLLGIPDGGRAAVRRPRRHRLHRRGAGRSDQPAEAVGAADLPVHAAPTAPARQGRALGHAEAGRRGALRRVDQGRHPPALHLARPPSRQDPRRRRPRVPEPAGPRRPPDRRAAGRRLPRRPAGSVHIGIVGEMHLSSPPEACISPTIRKWTVLRPVAGRRASAPAPPPARGTKRTCFANVATRARCRHGSPASPVHGGGGAGRRARQPDRADRRWARAPRGAPVGPPATRHRGGAVDQSVGTGSPSSAASAVSTSRTTPARSAPIRRMRRPLVPAMERAGRPQRTLAARAEPEQLHPGIVRIGRAHHVAPLDHLLDQLARALDRDAEPAGDAGHGGRAGVERAEDVPVAAAEVAETAAGQVGVEFVDEPHVRLPEDDAEVGLLHLSP